MATAKTKKKTKSAAKVKAVKGKKAVAAKAPAKKTAVKKAAVKKVATKKTTAKKAAVKKVTVKKTPLKKAIPKKKSTPTTAAKVVPIDATVEQKLKALYDLQNIDSQIDKIKTIRGELPLEVCDLEDEIEGLDTRVNNYNKETEALEETIKTKKNEMKDAKVLIKKYEEQQKNVRNNREYESLSKESEFQSLEIQLAEKKIKELHVSIDFKQKTIDQVKGELKERKEDLKHKKSELEEITAETKKEEERLIKKSNSAEKIIEERLLTAYKRIRANARNGLSVVSVERDSCGGCFNKIPPQRQLDIRMHKKVIVCEHCGRILVDPEIGAVKSMAK